METKRQAEVGPPTLSPDTFIPLKPFTEALGFGMPLYTTPELWEDAVSDGPHDLCAKVSDVIANALASQKADHPWIDFTWRYKREEGGKVKRVRLRVLLYQTVEGNPWMLINLGPLPFRYRAGRSIG